MGESQRERDRERERARRARVKVAKEGKKDIRWAISRGKSEISKDIDTALKQEEDKRAGPGSAIYMASTYEQTSSFFLPTYV